MTHSLEGCGSTTELCPLPSPTHAVGHSYQTGGERRIRTSEGISQQIYSLPPLTTWVSPRGCRWGWREESNPRPTDYKSVALPLSYASGVAPRPGTRTWPKRRGNCRRGHTACQDKPGRERLQSRATWAFTGKGRRQRDRVGRAPTPPAPMPRHLGCRRRRTRSLRPTGRRWRRSPLPGRAACRPPARRRDDR